jgi:VIT1/CCC1 family predicted Fe2+/Mn2+ transporter
MAEIAREREAIQMNGPEARELLSLYYQVKGLPEEDAQNMVNHIANDPEQLLRALASERLGTSEEALANPLVSAGSGALSTAVGAAIPIIPFFFMQGLRRSSPPPSSRWPRTSPSAQPSRSSPSAPGGPPASR